MVYSLIAVSLILILAIGVAALFLAGRSHEASSMEDPGKDEDE
jgi:nitrogen fixation-related uncharacterized protein